MHAFFVTMNELLARVGFMLKLSAAPWLSLWAIRFKADWDYKLSRKTWALRWIVVLVCYALAASLGSPAARIITGVTGLSFLSWPNFAYHLGKVVFPWPTTEARVVSVGRDGDRTRISYSYVYAGETFGGTAVLNHEQLSADDHVNVAYDPLNPEESRLASVSQASLS